MSKSVRLNARGIAFPNQCVICLRPATQNFTIERTLSYGNTSRMFELPVPMCQEHYEIASSRNALERSMNTVGLVAGALAGLASGWTLLSWWIRTNQGTLAVEVFLALIVALGIFLVVWIITGHFIGPAFADPKVKKARSAVKIDHFWPGNQVMQLTFANDQMGDLVLRESSRAG